MSTDPAPWSMGLLDATPRHRRTSDVEQHRIMDAIDRTRRDLGGKFDSVRIDRLVGVHRLTSVSASGQTLYLAVSMPSIVVAHLPDPIDDDDRIAMARVMLDVAEHALVVPEIDMDESLSRQETSKDLATLLGRIVRSVVGDRWVDPTFFKVCPPSPFGPATAEIKTRSGHATMQVPIPTGVVERFDLRAGWTAWEETKADASVILTSPYGIGAIPLQGADPVEIMREMAKPDMADFVQALAAAHPPPDA